MLLTESLSSRVDTVGWMGPWVLFLVVLYLLVSLGIAMAVWKAEKREPTKQPVSQPYVSVLVAARNEEKHLPACIDSLLKQHYPPELYEICIGNDGSTDRTAEIAHHYTEHSNRVRYRSIDRRLDGLQGKQNVLAQLAAESPASILLFADADVVVPPDWLPTYVHYLTTTRAGMVSAPTLIRANSIWSGLQALDWLVGTATLEAGDLIDKPMTAIGNNMGVTREAYDSVGGYTGLPFSITEDYALFAALLRKGWRTRFVWSPEVCSQTWPVLGWRELIHQRRRWLSGGMKGSWVALFGYSLYQAAPWATLVQMLTADLGEGLRMLAIVLLADLILLAAASRALQCSRLLLYFPLFAPYRMVLQVVVATSLFLRLPIRWKDRPYL